MSKPFSLVTTVFNESKRLEQTIADIENQSLKPAQIIIADAGSTDGTLERLRRWKTESRINIEVFVLQGCNIAEGRNEAIRRAGFDLIVSTDFGCRYHPDWLKSMVEPFHDLEVMVVGGAFTIIKEEVNNLAANADFVLQNGYPVDLGPDFSPSSRSIAYYKSVWEKIGGYQEWLTLAADDTIFWRMVKKYRFRYILVAEPYVYWLRHKTLTAFAKEAYRYGLGDGESGINFRNMWSHVAETVFRYAFFAGLIISPLVVVSAQWLCLFILIPLSWGLRSYKNAWKNWRNMKGFGGLSTLFTAFRLIEKSRWQYLKGYWKGWLFARPDQIAGRKNLEGIF